MNLPLFISRRIYSAQQGDKQKVSRPAIHIATIGIAVGLAVMIISVSVVLGFKNTIQDKIIGFGSHIQVGEFQSMHSADFHPVQMDDSTIHLLKKIPGVKHVQRFATKQGLLKTDSDFLGVLLKGVGPEFDTTFLHQNIIEGSIPLFSDKKNQNKIVLSKTMTDKLNLKCGQKIYAYFIDGKGVKVRRFTISGIYQTNLSQYDQNICFTDLYTTIKLNGWKSDQTEGAEITVDDFSKVAETESALIKIINRTKDKYGNTYTSKTIRELSPQLFSWLDLLDLNAWIIIAIMTAVAGITMISGLLIIILERTSMIGTMKALGTHSNTIRHTFLWFATFIITKGLIWGNLLGLGIIWIQRMTGFARLDPKTYYVSIVPVDVNFPLIILLNILTLTINIFILVAPSYLISHINPAKSIRYE